MDVKIPLTKLFIVLWVLWVLSMHAKRKANQADHSAFFARQKWTLENAYDVVWGLMGLIFLFKVLDPLWFNDASTDTYLYGMICFIAVLMAVSSHREAGQSYGMTWAVLGIDRTHFFGSGVVALNIVLVYSYLLASGAGIASSYHLATEASPFSSWLDPIVIGFGWVFIEELVFRGILYAPVARRIGKWTAIVVLAFVECLIHVDIGVSQTIVVFVVFVLLYIIYIRTESLWAPVILHIGINMPLWLPKSMPTWAPLVPLIAVDIWWLVDYLTRGNRDHDQGGDTRDTKEG